MKGDLYMFINMINHGADFKAMNSGEFVFCIIGLVSIWLQTMGIFPLSKFYHFIRWTLMLEHQNFNFIW